MEPPTSFGLWYAIGRITGEIGVRLINAGVGITLGMWERAARFRRHFH